MSVNKEDTLKQFCDVTGADEGRSRFFLDSSNWQLEVALSSFYEHGGNIEESSGNPSAVPSSLPTLSDSDMESPPGSPLQTKKDKKKAPTNPRFATLGSLQQQESSSDDEEAWKRRKQQQKYFCDEGSCIKHTIQKAKVKQKSDEEPSCSKDIDKSKAVDFNNDSLKSEIDRLERENSALKKELARLRAENERNQGEAFYAGGSERSGQQILGPPSKGNRKDIVTEMFKSVRERGAVVFEDEPSTANRGRGAFSGVGYRLGQTSDDQAQVQTNDSANADQARSVRLRLYREGFTVDSGPLRHYTDPQNAEFLSCIRRGEIPAELSASAGGGEVRVSLEDRRHEECPRSVSKTHAFTGKGQMLGSPTPPTVGATAPVAADASDRAANQRAAQSAVGLDETKPVTTIQFRLADGSRLTGRFNHSHTVGDLHTYVSRAEPSYQLTNFALLTSFPSAELTDLSTTIAAANLLNSTILQRIK